LFQLRHHKILILMHAEVEDVKISMSDRFPLRTILKPRSGSQFEAQRLCVKEAELNDWNLCDIAFSSRSPRKDGTGATETLDCTYITLDFQGDNAAELKEKFGLQFELVYSKKNRQELNYDLGIRMAHRHQAQGQDDSKAQLSRQSSNPSTLQPGIQTPNGPEKFPSQLLDMEIATVSEFGSVSNMKLGKYKI
jgi:hypothetical protein